MMASASARFDMTVRHLATHEDCLKLDPRPIFNDSMQRLRLLPNPNQMDRGHPQADLHHLHPAWMLDITPTCG